MITDFLRHGAENAIKGPELARRAGYTTTRDMQHAIHIDRENGELILSSGAGFFLPSDDEQQAKREIERFIGSLSSRARSTLAVLKTAKNALKRLGSNPLDSETL